MNELLKYWYQLINRYKKWRETGDVRFKENSEKSFVRNIDKGSAYAREKKANYYNHLIITLLLSALIIFVLNNRELSKKLTVNIPQPNIEVTFDGHTKEWTYRTMGQSPDSRERITRRYIKEYIVDREEVLPSKTVMDKKWKLGSRLFWRTERKRWETLERTLQIKRKKFEKQKKTRSVQVKEPTSFGNGWYHVEATFISQRGHQKPKTSKVTIWLQGKYMDLKMPSNQSHQNEIGFVIDPYSITLQEGELDDDGHI